MFLINPTVSIIPIVFLLFLIKKVPYALPMFKASSLVTSSSTIPLISYALNIFSKDELIGGVALTEQDTKIFELGYW